MAPSEAHAGQPAYMFVLPWDTHHVGGVNGVVLNLARQMKSDSALRPLIAINDWAMRRARIEQNGLRFRFTLFGALHPLGLIKSLLWLPLGLLRLRRLLRDLNVQIVNFHYIGDAALGVALLKRLGWYRGKLVLSVHGTDVRLLDTRVQRWMYRVVLQSADLIVAVSQGLARRAAQEFGLPLSRVTVIPNGVDHAVFSPEAATHGDAGRPLPTRYLASVGLYIPRKAYPCLLQAFALLATRYPDVHLVAAGNDGPEFEPLQREIDRLGLGSRVHLLQGLSPPQVAHLLARALACVQPSLAEGLPLAALEAGATGTPLVLSNIPGHDEIVEHEVSGVLFPVNDPAACAQAAARILDQPEFGQRLARAQRAQSLEKFTWSTCLASYLAATGVTPRAPVQQP